MTNSGQSDAGGDGIGDACEPGTLSQVDLDTDGLINVNDNCVFDPNPDQADSDGDGVGNACDPFNGQDLDGDGDLNTADNCPLESNSNQADADGDGLGDVCDQVNNLDFDNDDVSNSLDNCVFDENESQTDTDDDGKGDACDREHVRRLAISLSRHLIVKGALTTTGGRGACVDDIELALQRFSSGKWKNVDERDTSGTGNYQFSIADQIGKYRVTTQGETLQGEHRCRAATSAVKRHSH